MPAGVTPTGPAWATGPPCRSHCAGGGGPPHWPTGSKAGRGGPHRHPRAGGCLVAPSHLQPASSPLTVPNASSQHTPPFLSFGGWGLASIPLLGPAPRGSRRGPGCLHLHLPSLPQVPQDLILSGLIRYPLPGASTPQQTRLVVLKQRLCGQGLPETRREHTLSIHKAEFRQSLGSSSGRPE